MNTPHRALLALVLSTAFVPLAFGRDVSFSIDLKSRLPVFGLLRGEAKFKIEKSEEGLIGTPDFVSVGSAELRLGDAWILLPQCIAKFIQSSAESDADVGLIGNLMLKEPKSSTLRFVFRPGADVDAANGRTAELHFGTEPFSFQRLKLRKPGESEAVEVPLASVCADIERRMMLPRPL